MANYNFNDISYDSNLYFPRDPTSYLVKGMQASTTNSWIGNLPDGIDNYSDGLTIDYFLPYAGNGSNVTLNLSSKGEVPVYLGNSTTQVTTQYPQYSVIRLTYIITPGLNSGNGAWKASAYYDTNAGGTVTSITGTVGLTGTVTTSGNIKAKLRSEALLTNAAAAAVETTDRVYPVALDKDGYLAVNVPWTNINNNYITTHQTIKQDGVTGATGTHYGACTTAAGTSAKTASILNGTIALETGLRVIIKFANANTASNPTLNVNGTGAKNIFFNGTQITTNDTKALLSGAIEFVYDGSAWLLVGNFIDRDLLGVATYLTLGGVKPWKSYTVSSSGVTASTSATAPTINTITTTSGKYYAVEMDKDGRMFVNVPWVDTDTWVANSTTANGYVTAASTNHRVWGREGTVGWQDPNLLYLDNTSDAGLISSIGNFGWTSDCIVS